MSEQTIGYASVFKPTIWHRLGFGHAHVPPFNDDDDAKYTCSDIVCVFDWKDRLRLLITGRLSIALRVKTEHDAGQVEGRSAVRVMGWGWQR